MAIDIARTAAQDAAEALASLEAVDRELAHWRQHLRRVVATGDPGAAQQARRCGAIVGGIVAGAQGDTREAARRAEQPDPFEMLLS